MRGPVASMVRNSSGAVTEPAAVRERGSSSILAGLMRIAKGGISAAKSSVGKRSAFGFDGKWNDQQTNSKRNCGQCDRLTESSHVAHQSAESKVNASADEAPE